MEVLGKLEPKAVMHWFEEISLIPRGSLKEERIAAYIMRFARERGLACSEDEAHNVLVRKKASVGREDRPALVLQSHMDMICAKDRGVEHDFEKDGLKLYVDGDTIKARGTTLGADNGIGVAYQLAILDDDTLAHPPIEALFTAAEEIGMVGAIRFDAAKLKGKSMINFDAGGFTEGRIYVGCAGIWRGRLTQTLRYVPRGDADGAVRITVGGLRGGHSGGDIQKGYGNSSVIMGRLLTLLLAQGAQIASFQSGDVSQENKNGIPAECAVIACPRDAAALTQALKAFDAMLKDELSDVDDGVRVDMAEEPAHVSRVLSGESAAEAVRLLTLLPNGVQSMQRIFSDTPECSCNVGNVEICDGVAAYHLSVRSCKASLMDCVYDKYRTAAELTGCTLTMGGRLPGWDYDKASRIRQLVEAEYKSKFGLAPRFKVTHAGTECAIIKSRVPDMDIISMGPIIYEEHTTGEYMGIESVGVLWEFVKSVISRL